MYTLITSKATRLLDESKVWTFRVPCHMTKKRLSTFLEKYYRLSSQKITLSRVKKRGAAQLSKYARVSLKPDSRFFFSEFSGKTLKKSRIPS